VSLFDSFDPNSEELIQVKMQRSFQSLEDFPETVIAAFKEETFQLLGQSAKPNRLELCGRGAQFQYTGCIGAGGASESTTLWPVERGLSAYWSKSLPEARKRFFSMGTAACLTGQSPPGT